LFAGDDTVHRSCDDPEEIKWPSYFKGIVALYNNINTSRVHLARNGFLNFFRKVMKAREPRSGHDVTKAM